MAGTVNSLAIVKTLSGSPIFQPCVNFNGGGRSLSSALQGPLVDPRQEGVALILAQAPVVGEMAVARVRVPGGHALFEHRFANPAGPLLRVFIGQQRERPDFARPVAFLTALLDDGCDVPGIGHLALRGGVPRTFDRTAR